MLLPHEEWYVAAYWDLATERAAAGSQTLGRIPWSRAMLYGSHAGLDESALSIFWRIIRQMDVGYLEYMKGEHDRYVRANAPPKKKSPEKKPGGRYGRD